MLRPINNPPSRFDPTAIEWEIPPAPARLRVYEDDSKAILSKNESPDLYHRWSLNPYRGCLHACAYCYARPTHEYLGFGAGTDFDTRVVVKTRAPELLVEAFEARSWVGETVLFSGNTDCYQPLEHRYRLTRACLEVCARYRNPAAIITKAALIERDVDVLQELARVARIRVLFSIPFHDADTCRAIEPGTPSPGRRLKAMAALAKAGIPVGVNVAPLIPGLNDRDVPKVLQAAADAGATRAAMILVRLNGPVAPIFEERLREALPLRAEGVLARLRRARGGEVGSTTFGERMHGQGAEYEATRALFDLWCERLGLVRREGRLAEHTHAAALDEEPTTFRRPPPTRGQLALFGG